MTNQTNKKKEILDYLIREIGEGGKIASLRELCEKRGWSEKNIADKVNQMYPAVESGVSPMVPWLYERKAVEDLYDRWDAEPPEEIENIVFKDD